MASSKQAILPLWSSAAAVATVALTASTHFRKLCEDFADATIAADEAGMTEATTQMQRLVGHICTFKRRRFSKWDKEREAHRS